MPAGLVDFHSLYQLVHLQIYVDGLKLLELKKTIKTLDFVLINEGESNRKLPKIFAGKILRMT